MRLRHVWIPLGVGLVGVAIVAAWGVHASRSSSPPTQPSLERLDRYGPVPPFSLTERSGRRVGRDDLLGHVSVIDFIYTECTETCPTQSLQLAKLQGEFAAEPGLRLVSITVDPAHDTPEVLRAYADRYGATDRWEFLTGDKRTIYCLARDGFRLGVIDAHATEPLECGRTSWLAPGRAWASHGSQGLLMHSARLVIVDRRAQIRAYHLATDPDAMASLRNNLRAVLSEPPARSTGVVR
jgi:protein SCO1/2